MIEVLGVVSFAAMAWVLFLFLQALEHIRVLRDDFAKLKRIAFEQHQEIAKLQESRAPTGIRTPPHGISVEEG